MRIREFFSFKANKLFWLNIIAMVVLVPILIWGVLWWLDMYTRHGKAVLVPDVRGMSVEQAFKECRYRGLYCVVYDSAYVKEQPPGCVLDLNPQYGWKVKEGRTIYLTINTVNIPLYPVPDVADNSSLRQAMAKVLASGFKLNETEQVAGEKDWVYGVKYLGHELVSGDKVPLGAYLTLVAGNGLDSLVVDSLFTDSLILSTIPVEERDLQEDNTWF